MLYVTIPAVTATVSILTGTSKHAQVHCSSIMSFNDIQ